MLDTATDDTGDGSIAPWPEEGLEFLGKCPVCSGASRSVLYDGLTDTVFQCAPGKWTLWKCHSCGCGYLDPRPDRQSISLAYANYYTHGSRDAVLRQPLWRILLDRSKRAVFHDYVNHTFGHRLSPAIWGGRWLCRMHPRVPRYAGLLVRHVPRSQEVGERLLDVGCGDGNFLIKAQRLGYMPEGLEPDPAAAEVASRKGFAVSIGSLPGSGLKNESFTQITLHHVLEHLHDPMPAMREALALLRPGGRLWLATPNLKSPLLESFHEHWRGLEPPRHLVLFSAETIRKVLTAVGFSRVEILPPHLEARGMAVRSYRIMRGMREDDPTRLPPAWLKIADRANGLAWKDVRRGETVYAVAFK